MREGTSGSPDSGRIPHPGPVVSHLTAGPTCAHLHLIVYGSLDRELAPSLPYMTSAEIQYQNRIVVLGGQQRFLIQ